MFPGKLLPRALFLLLPSAGCLVETQGPPVAPLYAPTRPQTLYAPPPLAVQPAPALYQSPSPAQSLVLQNAAPGGSLQLQFQLQLQPDGTIEARTQGGPPVRAQATACFLVSMDEGGTVRAQPWPSAPNAQGRIVLQGPLAGYQFSMEPNGALLARPTSNTPIPLPLSVVGGPASLCYEVSTPQPGLLLARPLTPGVLQLGPAPQGGPPMGAPGPQAPAFTQPPPSPPVAVAPPQPPAVPQANNSGNCGYRCTYDTQHGTSDCAGAVTTMDGTPAAPVAQIDLSNFRELELTLHLCNPRGWVLNLGDSPSNNGYGGDSGQFSNDAEVQVVNEALGVYSNDFNPEGGAHLLYQNASFGSLSGCVVRRLLVRDGQLQSPSPVISLQSPYLLRLDGQDQEGPPDRRWFLALNRVIANTERSGTGLHRAELCLR